MWWRASSRALAVLSLLYSDHITLAQIQADFDAREWKCMLQLIDNFFRPPGHCSVNKSIYFLTHSFFWTFDNLDLFTFPMESELLVVDCILLHRKLLCYIIKVINEVITMSKRCSKQLHSTDKVGNSSQNICHGSPVSMVLHCCAWGYEFYPGHGRLIWVVKCKDTFI